MEICDTAYVLQLAELERHVLCRRVENAMQAAVGSQVELPSWEEIRGQFDADLSASPVESDPASVLLRELGVV